MFGFGHRRAYDVAVARPDSCYDLWLEDGETLLRRVADLGGFTAAEVGAAALWSGRQRHIGMSAVVRADRDGAAAVIEVFGPDNLVPHCIAFNVEDGVQVDEFDGDSRVLGSLEAALGSIAPL